MVKQVYFIFALLISTSCISSETSCDINRYFEIGDTMTYEKIKNDLSKLYFSEKYNYYYIIRSTSRDSYSYFLIISDKKNKVVDVLSNNPDIFFGFDVPDVISVRNDTINSVSYERKIDESHVFPLGVFLKNCKCPNLTWESVYMGSIKDMSFENDSITLYIEPCGKCNMKRDTIVSYDFDMIFKGFNGICSSEIVDVAGRKKGRYITYFASDSIIKKYMEFSNNRIK